MSRTRNDYRLEVEVLRVTRRPNTRNGNLVYRFHTSRGPFETKPDAGFVYDYDFDRLAIPFDAELTLTDPHNRIVGIRTDEWESGG